MFQEDHIIQVLFEQNNTSDERGRHRNYGSNISKSINALP